MPFAFNEKSLYIKTTWRNCFGSPDLGEEVPLECVGSFVTATASKGWAGLCLCDWTSCSRINCHCSLSLHHTDAQLLVKGIFHFLSLLSHKTSPDVTSPKDLDAADAVSHWERIEVCRLKYTFDPWWFWSLSNSQQTNVHYRSVISKWEFFIKMGVAFLALSFLHNSREDRGKKGSSHFDRTPQ